MRNRFAALLALVFLFGFGRECFAKPHPYAVLSASEYVNLPSGSHGGLYPTFGFSFSYDLPHDWSASPMILFEFSPEYSRWGFIGAVNFERAITKWLGYDLGAVLVQDQERDKWSEMMLFVGPNTGFSFIFSAVTLSVGVGAYVDVLSGSWVANPYLTFSVPLGQ